MEKSCSGSSTITIGDGTGGANQVNIVSTENSGILIVGGELDLPKNKNSAVDLDFTLEKMLIFKQPPLITVVIITIHVIIAA